jgi:hypothetical protein
MEEIERIVTGHEIDPSFALSRCELRSDQVSSTPGHLTLLRRRSILALMRFSMVRDFHLPGINRYRSTVDHGKA